MEFTITTYLRGHKVGTSNGRDWLYCDTLAEFDDSRPCIRCGLMPTKEGHDACLGTIPGVRDACCGHGVEEGYAIGDGETSRVYIDLS